MSCYLNPPEHYWPFNTISDWFISWNVHLFSQLWWGFEKCSPQTCTWIYYFSHTLSDWFNKWYNIRFDQSAVRCYGLNYTSLYLDGQFDVILLDSYTFYHGNADLAGSIPHSTLWVTDPYPTVHQVSVATLVSSGVFKLDDICFYPSLKLDYFLPFPFFVCTHYEITSFGRRLS